MARREPSERPPHSEKSCVLSVQERIQEEEREERERETRTMIMPVVSRCGGGTLAGAFIINRASGAKSVTRERGKPMRHHTSYVSIRQSKECSDEASADILFQLTRGAKYDKHDAREARDSKDIESPSREPLG